MKLGGGGGGGGGGGQNHFQWGHFQWGGGGEMPSSTPWHVYTMYIHVYTCTCRIIASITGRLKSSDTIKVSDRDTSHIYEYTSQALAGGERIYGCKERPFIASGLRLPCATSRPFYSCRARGVFSRLYEVQIHRYSTYMCLAANPDE